MRKKKTKVQPPQQPTPADPLIVGIGASAGGVEALMAFFEQVSLESGLAYVVILHLSPDYDSQLTALLQGVCAIPVTLVTETVRVEVNHVYVVPPTKHLHVQDGSIAVRPNRSLEDRRAPVDMFLRSLADAQGPRAVAVILSGTGANGSMGLKRIKENGGGVFVQNPREAAFNQMPRQAIATGLVDDILPVAQIPARLLAYGQSLETVQITPETTERPDEQQQALREIFTQLRMRTGHDFSNYKRPTLMRRIERRIHVGNQPHLPAYAAFLREHPEETQALLKDLLISVTNFFRDGKPFWAIEQDVLPALLHQKGPTDTVRIWVAGCATGEEAYSLAMLCAERTMDSIDAPTVQIFATDIDETAIATAREGRYTLNDAADVSPDRLRRFFTHEGDFYRIRPEIREMVLFAHHNVLKDPPFSRLDLVSCRNMLIYLNQTAQERVLGTFHFALRPGGYLLLGLSETTDGAGDLYAPISREDHLYQSRPVATRPFLVSDTIPALTTPRTLPPNPVPEPAPTTAREPRSAGRISYGELHQQLLEQYAPPSIVVNEVYDILHLSPRAGRYLHLAGGEPAKNLLQLVRPELRLPLRTAFYQAVQRQTNVKAPNLTLEVEGHPETITLQVRPVLGPGDPARGFMLVLFEPAAEGEPPQPVLTSEASMARHLEEELLRLKAQLRAAGEQHETQAEELKASNEELQAMNEELRSAAEELETSKEELQSINEELTTVNQELKVKVEEVSRTSNNLRNLINATDIATLFLDRSLRVNLFTPATRAIFNLIPTDFGRPLTDITHRLDYPHVANDAQAVLETLQPVEREVSTSDGRVFMMRGLPYRTEDDRINGIVLTFVDISVRRAAEEAVRRSEERMRLVFDSARDYAIFTQDTQRLVTSWSPGAQAVLGYTEADIIGQPGDLFFTPEDRQRGVPQHEAQTADQQGRAENERWHLRQNGERFWGSGSSSPLRDGGGQLLGFVKIMRDLTEHQKAQEARFFLASIVDSSQDSIITINLEGIITSWNRAAQTLYGYSATEAIGQPLTMLTLPDDLAQVLSNIDRIRHAQQVEVFDTVRLAKDGREMNLEVVLSPVKDEAGQVIGLSTIARDITERKRAEQIQALKNQTLRQQTESLARTGSWEYDRTTSLFSWSEGMYQLFGLEPGTPVTPTMYEAVALDADRPIARRIVAFLQGGTQLIDEVLRIQVGDTVKTIKVIGALMLDPAGQEQRLLGVDWDITEQQAAQEQIRQSAESLQAVLDASPASIGLLKAVRDAGDPHLITDFRLVVGNQKLAQFFDQPLAELLGQSAERFGDLLWDGMTRELLRQLYAANQPRYEEKHLSGPQGDRWLAVAVSRQDDGLVLTALDITELKQTQAQQHYWLTQLEAASQSAQTLSELRGALQQRGELLRTASHDLRGQVGVIASATELLGLAGSEAERSQMIDMIQRNIQQMTQLMSSLLDFARLEAGQEPIQLTRFDVVPVLAELISGAAFMAQERGLLLRAYGPKQLDVDSDGLQLRRIVQNLLLNAVKYTERGEVTLRWQALEQGWQLSVADTGPGLSASLLSRLRGEASEPSPSLTPTQSGGEGIGLSIVKRLCGLLGGELAVNSEPGIGTRFTIRFGDGGTASSVN